MQQEHFLIELPQLSNLYDEQKMWEEKDLYDHHVNERYGVECWQVPIPTNIKHNLNLDIMSKEPIGWLMHKFEHARLEPHIDTDRDTIIMFPHLPKKYEISYLDDLENQNVIFTHQYKCPTLLNSKIPHTVFDKGIDRVFFQISLFIKDYSWPVFPLLNN